MDDIIHWGIPGKMHNINIPIYIYIHNTYIQYVYIYIYAYVSIIYIYIYIYISASTIPELIINHQGYLAATAHLPLGSWCPLGS